MKNLIILLFLTVTTCRCNMPDNKTILVQLCFNKMHQNTAYGYLEKARLILVKNSYSAKLGKMHFGNNPLILTEIPLKNIKLYGSANDVVNNERHVIISQLNIVDSAAFITIRLANVNQIITFYLKKEGFWKVQHMKVSMA